MQSQQTLQWAKSFQGNSDGISVLTDALGNVYHLGNFSGTVDFDPGPGTVTITSSSAGSDLYLTKLDANGNFIWVQTTGSATGTISPKSMKMDLGGNFYITGSFSGVADFAPGFPTYNITSSAGNTFVLKLDQFGNFVWVKNFGAGGGVTSESIDIDNAGNSYITGHLVGTADFDPDLATYTCTSNGFTDAFITKLSASGSFIWAVSFGGPFYDYSYSIDVDVFGNVWTTGVFASTVDFDPSTFVFNLTSGTGYTSFLSKLGSGGNFITAKAFQSSLGSSFGHDLTSDPDGNIYSTGFIDGITDFDPGTNSFNLTTNGTNDAYVSKLDNSGSFIWAKSFGGSNIEIGWSIALDNSNNVYVTGNYKGPGDFDPGIGTYSLTHVGNDDTFILKLDNNGNFSCASGLGGNSRDFPSQINVDSNDNIFITGHFQGTADFDPSPATFSINPVGSTESFLCSFKQNFTGTPLSYTICEGASTVLTGVGATTYSWSPSIGLSSTFGTTVTASPTISTSYTVVGNTGCIRTTTLINITVLPKPNLTTQSVPVNLICDPDSVLLQSTSTTTNVLFQWRKQTSSTYTNQPYYAKVSGPYYSKVTNLLTGCADSSIINVNNFKIYPNAKITSHIYTSALIPLDTVTCYSPTINVTGASDTSGVLVSWKSISSNSIYVNPIPITSLGNYKLFVKRNDNNCIDSSIIVLINQNTTVPSVLTNTNHLTINCSVYSASLNASYSPSNCNVFWLNPTNAVIPNPSIVYNSGKYKFSATDPENGCVKYDSVNVLQSNLLLLNSSNDTIVCKNAPAYLAAAAIGTISNITYSWSTSQFSNSIVVSPSITTNFIVTASSGSGCFGTDTVEVIIPPDIKDSVITARSCDSNAIGSIVVFAKGGIAPYYYSINNGSTFTTTNTFQNIPFGVYSVVIKDSIGCLKQTSVTLNSNSNLPVPKFLASTKNFKSDTIVLVDVSIPKPDSVHWQLPSIASIIGGNMFNPVVLFSDTGNFSVTMKSFYGNCIINATKIVRFAPFDSLQANYHNASGIKTFSLYPNPNNGQFSIFVEFYKKQDATVQIYDVNSYKHYQQNYFSVQSFTLPIDVSNLLNGAYLLRVIGEYDAKHRSFIISK